MIGQIFSFLFIHIIINHFSTIGNGSKPCVKILDMTNTDHIDDHFEISSSSRTDKRKVEKEIRDRQDKVELICDYFGDLWDGMKAYETRRGVNPDGKTWIVTKNLDRLLMAVSTDKDVVLENQHKPVAEGVIEWQVATFKENTLYGVYHWNNEQLDEQRSGKDAWKGSSRIFINEIDAKDDKKWVEDNNRLDEILKIPFVSLS